MEAIQSALHVVSSIIFKPLSIIPLLGILWFQNNSVSAQDHTNSFGTGLSYMEIIDRWGIPGTICIVAGYFMLFHWWPWYKKREELRCEREARLDDDKISYDRNQQEEAIKREDRRFKELSELVTTISTNDKEMVKATVDAVKSTTNKLEGMQMGMLKKQTESSELLTKMVDKFESILAKEGKTERRGEG